MEKMARKSIVLFESALNFFYLFEYNVSTVCARDRDPGSQPA